MMVLRRAVILTILLATVAGASPGADSPEGKPPQSPEDKPPQLPNLTLFRLEESTSVKLESFKGKPVLLTFWASWCAPCRWELPEFQKLHEELAEKGFVLITVNVDYSKQTALRFLKMTGLEIPVYRLTQAELIGLGVNSLPTSMLLKPDGSTAEVFQGYSPAVANYVREVVLEMLEEQQAAKEPPKG